MEYHHYWGFSPDYSSWLVSFCAEIVMTKEIGIHEPSLSSYDEADVPKSILGDAVGYAEELFGENQKRRKKYKDQLIGMYMEVKDSDIVIIFNSGGWGWNLTQQTPGWASILNGIKSELERLGYSSIVLNYRRTGKGVLGCVHEFFESARRYPSRAEDLAKRIEFLTEHMPDVRVIITGESTGTIITDRTMVLLRDNPQVYSIQTGMPFWHKPGFSGRTLLINTNGRTVDTFSDGKVPVIVRKSFKSWIGLSSPKDEPGDIISWLKAPGHHYTWEYPGVYTKVIEFLQTNFGGVK